MLAHEFGHFIAARRCGMKVEEFGFGFPPRVFGLQFLKGKSLKKIAEVEEWDVHREENSAGEIIKETIIDEKKEIDVVVPWHRRRLVWGNRELGEKDENYGTVYSLNWLPLGGFVKIKGENGELPGESDSFMSKPAWQKSIVLCAGVAMNILLAAVLLSAGYMFGLPGSTEDAPASAIIQDQRVEIIQAIAGKPAQLAGLTAGDAIVKIDALEKPTIVQMQSYLDTKRDTEVVFTIRRGQEVFNKTIKPVLNSDTGKGGIGVAIADIGIVKYPWYQAIYHGFADAFIFLKEICVAFYLLIVGLFAGRGAAEAVTGPVGIAVLTGQVARLGLAYLVQFTAMLSLNLALINILPIPALDGGRVLFVWLGKIFKKPVFMKFEQLAHTVGFALLMLLVVVVTVKDLGTFKGMFVNFFNRIF